MLSDKESTKRLTHSDLDLISLQVRLRSLRPRDVAVRKPHSDRPAALSDEAGNVLDFVQRRPSSSECSCDLRVLKH